MTKDRSCSANANPADIAGFCNASIIEFIRLSANLMQNVVKTIETRLYIVAESIIEAFRTFVHGM